jgi:sterol desaturase/sphingolipid hydroxylase (fatty acid hydroxylase superfamily)
MNISMKISFVIYWTVSLILFWFSKKRIFRPKSIINVLKNQLLFQWPLFELIFYMNFHWKFLGTAPRAVHIWPISPFHYLCFPLQLLFCQYWHGFWFYWMHRLMHKPMFYKPIHSIHHLWVHTEAYSAFDCHPIEHILCNLLPLITGAYISRINLFFLPIVSGLGTLSTVIAHDSSSNSDHLLHHRHPSYNFESTFDWIFGTDINSN